MPKRIVRITSTASIKAHHACLAIEHDDAIASIPFRDIGVVIIESQQATISTAALSALIEAGAVVVHCDTKHMPSGIALPFASNFRHAAVSKAQLAMPRPLQKRIWQRVVRAKIENQAHVLDILGLAGAAVRGIGQFVQSGDTTNREAVAAATYFRKLLPHGGRRDSTLSPALDYGYAVLRAAVAREVVAKGFLPSFGIHHESNENAFNLVDDLLEPFRPIVDLLALSACSPDGLTSSDRQILSSVLVHMVDTKFGKTSVTNAIEFEVDSFKRAIEKESADELVTPSLIALETFHIE